MPAGMASPQGQTPTLLPFGASLPEGPLLLHGVSTLAEAASLIGREVYFCGSWITTALPKALPNPAQPALLELLSLIVRDADTPDLEKVFAKAPQLTVNLLRLVNSVGMGTLHHTASIRQAIALLGRRQLQRWLQLLLYAEQYSADGSLPPLFVAAALRAKRMEQWALAGWIGEIAPDAAFMTGMLSLLDRLFGKSLESLLAPLPLAPEITAGLLHGKGEVGEALIWLELAEKGEIDTLVKRTRPRVDDLQRWMQAEIDALGWAYELMGTQP